MDKLPKICRFTQLELNVFRKYCNFTNDELQYFDLKAADQTNVRIAMTLNVSEAQVSKLARRVKDKMKRIPLERLKEVLI